MRTCSSPRALAVACLLLASACVEPGQYGGPIPIDAAGLQARLERLCTMTGQTVGCAALALEEEEPAAGH